MRRSVDVAVALLAGLLLLPAMLAIGFCIACAMGAPILFTQRRSGKSGRPFMLIKFRSMTEARDRSGKLLGDDARTTRLGRALRRTRLDELPELWNILKGDMSLIGPRPLLPETIEALGEAGVARGAVRPGLTGWAQVHGNALLAEADKVALDLWYIDHRSLRCDLNILFRTVGVMVSGERVHATELEKAYAGSPRRGR